jgi:hypothetical protein
MQTSYRKILGADNTKEENMFTSLVSLFTPISQNQD